MPKYAFGGRNPSFPSWQVKAGNSLGQYRLCGDEKGTGLQTDG